MLPPAKLHQGSIVQIAEQPDAVMAVRVTSTDWVFWVQAGGRGWVRTSDPSVVSRVLFR
jgi:hypothetical protein